MLKRIGSRTANEISGVTRVAHAISSKPLSTIEPC
ncbi:hypothetical protein DRO03_04615 [Methanosarcinales archaeon]|nr:MAG: hypothetical protein DRO03_04615 [Methanosarcinales archaeon]